MVPGQLDGDMTVQWIPRSASARWGEPDAFETLNVRASGFARLGDRTVHGYLQYYRMEAWEDEMTEGATEVDGFGLGVGMAW